MRAMGEAEWPPNSGKHKRCKEYCWKNLYNDPVEVDELQTDICAVKLSFFIINYPFLFDILSQETD